MKFGENLYNLRKSKKMSQEILAENVGVSRQSVSKWENGESYPEMDHILKICKIFHCKINDLIHEDLQDIDSLDEDIKMKVVKLEKEKQKKLKVMSKIIYILAKIGKIATRVAAVCTIVIGVFGICFAGMIEFKDSSTLEIHSKDEIVTVKKDEMNKINISGGESADDIQNNLFKVNSEDDLVALFDNVYPIFEDRSKGTIIGLIIAATMLGATSLVLLGITLSHLEKLFKNVNEGETPFTLDNVFHIKRMSFYMIAVTIVSGITAAVTGLIFKMDVNINIGYSVIYILFMFSIAYIFEYGYHIQQDSQSKIYDGEEKVEN